MGPKERRQREREEVRTRILDAAREMFATEGYEAVTMRRIAQKIEYSPTAIYFHFKDKDALIRQLCDTDFLDFGQRFAKLMSIADPVERLRQAGHTYIEFGIEYPNHFRLMFMTPHPPMKPEDSELERGNVDQDAYAFVRAICEQAIAEGRFREELQDVDLIAQTVWAGVHGVIALEIAKGCDKWVEWRDIQQRADRMIDVLIDGLLRVKE